MHITKNMNIALFLICIFYSLTNCDTEFRFSLGPAWHNFFTTETFNLVSSKSEIVAVETIEAVPEFMPYLEGRFRAQPAKFFNVQLIAGGGGIGKGRTEIAGFREPLPGILIKGRREAVTDIKLACIDANVGFRYEPSSCCFVFNPLVGYVFNKEKLDAASLVDRAHHYKFNNIWRGPYVGIEAAVCCREQLLLRGFYKFVFGNVCSDLMLKFPSELLKFLPDSEHSIRKALMFGNLVGLEMFYKIDCWNIGANVMFFSYKNRKLGSVTLSPQEPKIVESASLKRILWEQLITLFFAEYTF